MYGILDHEPGSCYAGSRELRGVFHVHEESESNKSILGLSHSALRHLLRSASVLPSTALDANTARTRVTTDPAVELEQNFTAVDRIKKIS
jgi:hypothetical protein